MREDDPRPGFHTTGQPVAERIAVRTVLDERLGQPLLVHGPPGSGKGAFVADLVALLTCQAPLADVGPCNTCRPCRRARAGTHSDVVFASPQAWRESRQGGESIVAVTRRWLLDTSSTPVEGDRRIIVVDHADLATEHSQNALLKALEEPPPRHVFILVADEPERLLPTIRSRCQELRIGPVPRAQLAAWLARTFDVAEDEADALARLSGGRIGLAARLAGKRGHELRAWRERLQRELLTLVDRGRAERLGAARDAIDDAMKLVADASAPVDAESAPAPGAEGQRAAARAPAARQRAAAIAVVDVWLALARDLLVAAAGRPAMAVAAELGADLASVADRIGAAPLVRFIGRLEEIRDGLVENASARLALEVAMLEWPAAEANAA